MDGSKRRSTAGSKMEAREEELSKMTLGFASWLAELIVLLLRAKGRPTKCWERKAEAGAAEKL